MTNTINTTFWWESAAITVELNPVSQEDAPGTVLVGLGNGRLDAMQHGVALSAKGMPKDKYRSVSAFVHGVNSELAAQWRSRFNSTGSIRKIVVEDFSLDTCFALQLFGELIDGGNTSASQRDWLRYVDAWEGGEYLDDAQLERSAACVLSCLAHSWLPGEVNGVIRDGIAAIGLRSCLGLLQQMIAVQPQPLDGILPLRGSTYIRALGQLAHDRQLYALALKRAHPCQLLVPLANSDRKVLLDALFLSETQLSGVLKVMARIDTANTWTHHGFGLLGIYRAGEQGTGNDMTVSTNPANGATLVDLWRDLEAMENHRWKDARPTDTPRRLHSYLDAQTGDPISGAPNQPWYDEDGHYTLLGAPKRLAINGPLGSRLDWYKDVVPLVWQRYFLEPVEKLVDIVASTTAHAAAASTTAQSRKRIVQAVRRIDATDDTRLRLDQAILDTPTFHAWLAAQSTTNHTQTTPFNLPRPEDFDTLTLGGVTAVLHGHGITLYRRGADDARLSELHNVTQRMAQASHDYDRFLQSYGGKFSEWMDELACSHTHGKAADKVVHKSLERWAYEMMHARTAALAALSNLSVLEADPDRATLAEHLQRKWGLAQKRADVSELLNRIDELMREMIEARTEKRQVIYGAILSAVGLGVLSTQVWEPIKGVLTINNFEWQLMMFRQQPPASYEHMLHIAEEAVHYEWWTVGIALGFTALGALLYWIFGIKGAAE